MEVFSLSAVVGLPGVSIDSEGANGLVLPTPVAGALPVTAGGVVEGVFEACCCLAAVACLAFSTVRATLAGQVGSRGEWRRSRGVVKKRCFRSSAWSAVFILRAQAVQLEVNLPFNRQVSA